MRISKKRFDRNAIAILIGVLLGGGTVSVEAQSPTPSFSLVGHLQQLDVTNLADPLSDQSVLIRVIRG